MSTKLFAIVSILLVGILSQKMSLGLPGADKVPFKGMGMDNTTTNGMTMSSGAEDDKAACCCNIPGCGHLCGCACGSRCCLSGGWCYCC